MNPSREIVPLQVADISIFCKSLRQQLVDSTQLAPSHLTLLNMLARSAGHRNFQALKATPAPAVIVPRTQLTSPIAITLPRGSTVPPPLRRLLACFDTEGRLMRWPKKFAVQQIALWALWSRLPAQRDLTEKEVNRTIEKYHTYGDFATLRRELVNAKLLWRTTDCRTYRKEARRPNEEVRQFLQLLFSNLVARG